MKPLERFFHYIQQLDRRDESLLGTESGLYLFAYTIAHKPLNILNIGLGSGDAALTLLFARNTYIGGSLTCFLPAETEGEVDPQLLTQLESNEVTVIRDVNLTTIDHAYHGTRYDLITVDLSKINTTTDFPHLLAFTREKTQIFLYASVVARRQALFAEALPQFPSSQWRIDVITSQFDKDSIPTPDMLAVRSLKSTDKQRILIGDSTGLQNVQPAAKEPIYLALPPPANYFGWGLCSRYLRSELGALHPIHVLEDSEAIAQHNPLKGKVFHALRGIRLDRFFENVQGEENYAYTFFENELLPESVQNAKCYDLVLGGSTWCRDRMLEKGIRNSGVLIQGIDPRFFHPIKKAKSPDKFVLFSGGKFEPRKGQDLILAAFKALQDKYPDMVLVTCWHNLWPQSMDLMASSKLIQYERKGESWAEIMTHIYLLNGLDPERIFTIDLVPNETQRDLYSKTDIGIFPNRCEGGTNLVLMEYMACAKPVIGAYSTGQKDVLTAENALLLKEIKPYEVKGSDGTLVARWTEPSLEELIVKIEYAYHNRDKIRELGLRAGEDLKQMTWTHTAKSLLRVMGLEVRG